jgi:hypothetical protein
MSVILQKTGEKTNMNFILKRPLLIYKGLFRKFKKTALPSAKTA